MLLPRLNVEVRPCGYPTVWLPDRVATRPCGNFDESVD